MIGRAAKWLVRKLLGLIAFVVVVYLLVIHPNDARMSFPEDVAKGPIPSFFDRRGAMLLDKMPHTEDLTAEAYQAKRQALLTALPDYALPSSVRFVSPYQIYVPLGAYPLRLDAQDGVFIPAGATLSLEPRLVGTFDLRFAAYSPRSAGTLTMGSAGTGAAVGKAPLLTVALPEPPHPWIAPGTKLYSEFVRFLRVDPTGGLETWQPARTNVTLATGERLTFACAAGATFGCILGDVTFYQPRPAQPQSVLIVLVDTLRSDALRAGNGPHMAALADQGVEFTHALSAGNMTSPSTNAFLSCRRPSQLGQMAFSYGMSPDTRESYYRTRHPSFPARFLQSGYDTAMIGNVSVISEIYGVGVNHGFTRQISLETDGYDTPAIAREAISWLAMNGDHPFLLYLHFNGPHAPYRPPFRDVISTSPGLVHGLSSYADALRWLYQGEVAYTDRYLAKVLDALKTLGLDDHTTIVLTADHGDQHTIHKYSGNTAAPDFTGAYFDHGATLLDDEIHVPLVIRRPGAKPGRVDDVVSTLDLGPTLLELTGAGDTAGCAGESLKPYLDGGDLGDLKQRVLTSEGFRARMLVFDGRYKYIRTYEPTDKRLYTAGAWRGKPSLYLAPEQLFDLATDPKEEADQSAEQPERMALARALYRDVFGIKDSYELILDMPEGSPFAVTLPAGADVRFEEGEGRTEVGADSVRVTGGGRERVLLEVRDTDAEALERTVAKIGGVPMTVAMTSLKLPLKSAVAKLPAETGGRYSLLAPDSTPRAYLRKVEDDGQRNRRLLSGNPAFEKVLREWGYLNDK